ncbi:MAG: hypothetical protein GY809_02965 [Planctomycetes bacterium]|nr:hypothetical protein [Planctomycetota bacterium]
MIMRLAIMVFIFVIGLRCGVIVLVVAWPVIVMMSMRLCEGQYAGQNLNRAMVVQRFMGKCIAKT